MSSAKSALAVRARANRKPSGPATRRRVSGEKASSISIATNCVAFNSTQFVERCRALYSAFAGRAADVPRAQGQAREITDTVEKLYRSCAQMVLRASERLAEERSSSDRAGDPDGLHSSQVECAGWLLSLPRMAILLGPQAGVLLEEWKQVCHEDKTQCDHHPSSAEKSSNDTAVLQAIMRVIVSGEWEPGAVMTEMRLTELVAAQNGSSVSRTPIRDALRKLEGAKLVDRVAGRLARLRGYGEKELIEMWYLRRVAEAKAVWDLAFRIRKYRVPCGRWLLASLRRMADASARRDSAAFTREDSRFHCGILEMSGRPVARQLLELLLDWMIVSGSSRLDDDELMDLVIAEHAVVATAVMVGDSRSAFNGMKEHLKSAQERQEACRLNEQCSPGVMGVAWSM
jgi:DNA-binding GntR family transcriptional regulator